MYAHIPLCTQQLHWKWRIIVLDIQGAASAGVRLHGDHSEHSKQAHLEDIWKSTYAIAQGKFIWGVPQQNVPVFKDLTHMSLWGINT